MMYSCQKCLENSWSYTYIEGMVIATCKFCSHVVEFPSKKLKREIAKEKLGIVDKEDLRHKIYDPRE